MSDDALTHTFDGWRDGCWTGEAEKGDQIH